MQSLAGAAELSSVGIVISHDWSYNEQYEGIVALLNGVPGFHWKNLSVPRENPIPASSSLPRSNATILRSLEGLIKQADCLVVLAGVYVTGSNWIQTELDLADQYGKPVIGVKPRGQERVSKVVRTNANEMVNWNGASIVAAIRRLVPSPAYPNLSALAASKFLSSGSLETSPPSTLMQTLAGMSSEKDGGKSPGQTDLTTIAGLLSALANLPKDTKPVPAPAPPKKYRLL
jgi:hypothetical protein